MTHLVCKISYILSCFLLMQLLLPGRYGALRAEQQPCLSRGWPFEGSDLQPDPAVTFGRLKNGVRYVFIPNQTPKQRVALFLNVQAGSLYETEKQRGVAHFLEHMLFNGTSHYPPGTLIKFFQSIGMTFGGDTNAHTSFDETVYNLLLPSGSDKILEEGFQVLADYARGASLLEEEVNRERGIILAEKRSRDSAAARVSKEQLRFDFAGTRIATRDPIGVEEVLKSADSNLLRAFYNQWYRPENFVVVVVGDTTIERIQPLVTKYFASLKAEGPAGLCPEFGAVRGQGSEILYVPDKELGYAGLALTTVYNVPVKKDTKSWEQEQLYQYVATTLVARRLRQLELQAGSALNDSGAMSGIFLRRAGYASVTARSASQDWQAALRLLKKTVLQAMEQGFSEEELAKGRKEVLAYLEKQVQTADSRESGELASQIIAKINRDEVPLSPQQEMDLYRPMLEKMTLAQVNQSFRHLWQHSRSLIEVVGAVGVEQDPQMVKKEIQEVYNGVNRKDLDAWTPEISATFPYLHPKGASLQPVEHIAHDKIGVQSIILPGGVQVNCKQTDFQKNQVLFSVEFGQGKESERQPGMSLLAESLVDESGIGQLTREQLNTALIGTNISLNFHVGPESFSFTGRALNHNFEQLLQLTYHRLHDPAFRASAFQRSREKLQQMYTQLERSAEGVQQITGAQFLTGKSGEYSLPSWEELSPVQLSQLEAWLHPVFKQAPLEINIVGDIDPAQAIQLVRRYFGAEHRQEIPRTPASFPIFPAGQHLPLTVASSIDKAVLTVAWQTNDFWDISRTRRLNVLASVLDDRLRVKVREELGATYSPQVFSQPSKVRDGFGLLQTSFIVAPTQADSLLDIIVEVAAEIGENGVSQDELTRALRPTLTSIKDMQRTNRYWLESVLNLSSRHPEQLQWPLTITNDFAAISAEEVQKLAQHYLQKKMAATVMVLPEAAIKK